MTIEAGTRLGPYEIVSRLGAGGMGEVWRARDTRLERSVAVKILPAEFAQNAQLRIRFEREAKTISQLEHAHICRLYDVGENYLVMELIDGESLADRLARGPLPLPEVVRFGAQIAEALDRAHRAGVIHRDLKPGNIMLTKSGAKLLDFGLAKSSAIEVSEDGATVQKPLTQEGTILGTFQYMAPEQLEGQEADARTDIFAFGAVLYEMATGRRAFQGRTKTSLIAAIVKEQPTPLSQIQPLTPPALDHVIQRCLEKDPEDRWQSARDVAEELRWVSEAGTQAGVATPLVARRRNRERIAWTLAALALAAVATVGALSLRTRGPAPVYSFTVPRSDGPYSLATTAVVSPDGTRLCFAARTGDGKRMIFVRSIGSFDVRALDGTENGTLPHWSSDGRSIAFIAGEKLKVVDVNEGAARAVTDARDVFGIAMNGDGDLLLGSGLGGIRHLRVNEGSPTTLTALDKSRHEIAHIHPTFLPDGKRFLFTSLTRDPAKPDQLHELSAGMLGSKEVRRLGAVPSLVTYVDPGFLLFVRDGTLMAVGFDAASLEMRGEPETVLDGVYYFRPTGNAAFSASRNGVVTYRAPFGGESLAWFDRTGRKLGTVGPVGDYGAFRVSRDGSSVVAAVVDTKIGTADLWTFGTRRETASRLTFDRGYESLPVMTPDGTRLFYGSDRIGVPDICVERIGSGEVTILVSGPGEQYPNDLSPDGRLLLYESNDYTGRRDDLLVIASDGTGTPQPFLRTPFGEWNARFSPDGKWVAYMSDESGRTQVYVRPFPGPGQARQISTGQGQFPRWSPDGTRLYYRDGHRVYAADVTRPDAEPALLFETDEQFEWMDVAPDGERFLLGTIDEQSTHTPTRVIVNWPELLRQRSANREDSRP